MAAILGFGNFAMSRMLFDVTSVCGIPETPILATIIIHLLRSYQNLYPFLFWNWPKSEKTCYFGGHIGFMQMRH
ncbi:MAG: hypothetical protein ABW185_27115, partial [Sedimenticola sp.]